MQPKVLWVLADEYFIGSIGDRFRIKAGDVTAEFAARGVYCLVLDGGGSISSSAIGLARTFDVPTILVNDDDVEGFMWVPSGKSIESLMCQIHAYLNLRETFSSLFLRALKENYERTLNIALEGDVNDIRRTIASVLEERWSSSANLKANYARLLLSCVCWAALYKAGLNPDIGFLNNKLCYDLACEFEHRVTLEAVKIPDLEGAEFRRAIAKIVDDSLQGVIKRSTPSSRPRSLLSHIHAHARALASTLRSGLFNYKPFIDG